MWANEYVGLPFLLNGRDRNGLDCWGLYRLVVQEKTGLVLPSFDTVDATNCRAVADVMTAEAGHGEAWFPVPLDCADDFDCVLMRSIYTTEDGRYGAGDVHVGCFVWPGHVLHIEKRHDAVLQQIVTLKDRVKGIYRHKDLLS